MNYPITKEHLIESNLHPKKPKYDNMGRHVAINISNLHNSNNLCIDGDCYVLMANGYTKSVKEIKKGDYVMSSNNESACVRCVIRTDCFQNKTHYVKLDEGLLITPWHPVRINGVWKFPQDLGNVIVYDTPSVYNFVLDKLHIMTINNVECVTLGHGFQEPVVKHPFFGTEKVIEDFKMKYSNGWNKGLILLNSASISRDVDTGMVNSFL